MGRSTGTTMATPMPIEGARPGTEERLPTDALHRLLAWLSPAFPVGAYTYSHGLEMAVEEDLVRDRATLADWVGWIVEEGTGRIDADLLREAWLAVAGEDPVRLLLCAEEGDCLRGTAEMALESAQQGQAFLRAIRDAWPCPGLTRWSEVLQTLDRPVPYPVAVGVVAALEAVPLTLALHGYLHALGANLVSAGVRLVPLGQTDGQRALAALVPAFARAARTSISRRWEDRGAAAPMVDWTSMRHETQYTRLFRS